MQLPNKSINDITRQQLYHISGSYYIPSIQENQACFLHNCTFLSCSYFCGVGSQISNLVYPWFESSPSKQCSLSHSILNPSLKSSPALEISRSKSEVGPWFTAVLFLSSEYSMPTHWTLHKIWKTIMVLGSHPYLDLTWLQRPTFYDPEIKGISASEVLSNPFTVFFFLRNERHSATTSRIAMTIPTAMAINCHTLNWNTGVFSDSAALTELLGDDISFGLSDEQTETMR